MEFPELREILIRTLILRCRQESHADFATRLPLAVFGVRMAGGFWSTTAWLADPSFVAGRSALNVRKAGPEREGSNDMVDCRIIPLSTGLLDRCDN